MIYRGRVVAGELRASSYCVREVTRPTPDPERSTEVRCFQKWYVGAGRSWAGEDRLGRG